MERFYEKVKFGAAHFRIMKEKRGYFQKIMKEEFSKLPPHPTLNAGDTKTEPKSDDKTIKNDKKEEPKSDTKTENKEVPKSDDKNDKHAEPKVEQIERTHAH